MTKQRTWPDSIQWWQKKCQLPNLKNVTNMTLWDARCSQDHSLWYTCPNQCPLPAGMVISQLIGSGIWVTCPPSSWDTKAKGPSECACVWKCVTMERQTSTHIHTKEANTRGYIVMSYTVKTSMCVFCVCMISFWSAVVQWGKSKTKSTFYLFFMDWAIRGLVFGHGWDNYSRDLEQQRLLSSTGTIIFIFSTWGLNVLSGSWKI